MMKDKEDSVNVILNQEVDDSYILTFGKHKGESLGAVPASYLLWFYEQADSHKTRPLVYNYIKKNLKHLEKEAGEKKGMPDMEDDWHEPNDPEWYK
jgi:hypothetical protein